MNRRITEVTSGCNTEIKTDLLRWFSFHPWAFPIHEMKKKKNSAFYLGVNIKFCILLMCTLTILHFY